MKRTPLDLVKITASDPWDLAFKIGKKRKKHISKHIDYWNRFIAKKFSGKKDLLKSVEKSFFDVAEDFSPEYVEEIRALAEGADVPFKDLFRLNLTELKFFAEKCTTVIFKITAAKKSGILIAHNEDWEPAQNDVFILDAKMPDVSYKILTYDGYLPGLSCGINSFGLAHAVNFVRPKDLRPALPRIFVTRQFLTSPSIAASVKWIASCPRAFGQSIHLAQGTRYQGIEVTARSQILRKVSLPTIHANHYLEAKLKKIAASASPSSCERQAQGEEMLARLKKFQEKKSWSPTAAKKACAQILSDRTRYPLSIWREADHPDDASATVASARISTLENSFEVTRVAPEKNVWRKL